MTTDRQTGSRHDDASGTSEAVSMEPLRSRADDAPRPTRRRLRRVAQGVIGTLAALALVASGLSVVTARQSFPEYDGDLSLPGLGAPVTVYRDSYGVPQVYARSATDLFRAQGYVTAQDRFWEMDFRRHLTSGRLAELFGPSMVPTDALIRTLGWRRVAEQEWRMLSPATKSYLRAYADGVNAWIDANGGREASGEKSLEYSLLGVQNPDYTVERWDPVDSVAWLKAMAWNLMANMGAEARKSAMLADGLTRKQLDQLQAEYPYERNHPVVERGAVVGGAFDVGASPAAPASDQTADGDVTNQVWRDAAPVFEALGSAVRSLPVQLDSGATGVGSNAWVVSGEHTESGEPLLANDPHLAPSIPGIWYQVGLHCACSFDVEGYSLAGMPGVLIGHNDDIAWGLTNLGADVSDLYLEKVKDGRYFDGTGWRDLTTRNEVIRVAGGKPVTVTVRASEHGPLVSDRSADILRVAARPPVDASGSPLPSASPAPDPTLDAAAPGVPDQAESQPYAVALRWTGLEPGRTVDAILALDQATSWKEFRAAAALVDDPAQNLVYADAEGHIGYQAPGRIPVRSKGDGAYPVPGWDPSYDWKGYIPFAELPYELDPPSGVVVTANQPVVGPSYPYPIAKEWAFGYRSQRVDDLLAERTARGKVGVADMRQIQLDSYNGSAPFVVPALLAAPIGTKDDSVTRARNLLQGWNFQQPAESPPRTSAAAAFYNATWRHLMKRTFDEVPGGGDADGYWWELVRSLLAQPSSPWWDDERTGRTETRDDMLAAAMADATAELTDRLGEDPEDWRWGDLHTLSVESNGLGQSGIAPVERLFNRGPVPTSGGSSAVNATSWYSATGYDVVSVPTMRMIVDMSDLDRSRWVQLTGNSGHAFHPNYADQLELWRTGRDTPMRWGRQEVESAARHVLTLEPVRIG